jgi:hypothetical protein
METDDAAHGSYIASLVPPPRLETNYILVSPLLRPIASITTFFSSAGHSVLSKVGAERHGASVQRILALYGTGDVFAFSTGIYRRHFEHIKQEWRDKIVVHEVDDGGHFWFDARAKRGLAEHITAFIEN